MIAAGGFACVQKRALRPRIKAAYLRQTHATRCSGRRRCGGGCGECVAGINVDGVPGFVTLRKWNERVIETIETPEAEAKGNNAGVEQAGIALTSCSRPMFALGT